MSKPPYAVWGVVLYSLQLLSVPCVSADPPPADCACQPSLHTHCHDGGEAIPDSGTLVISIAVPWEYILMDVSVCLDITHPHAADLDLELRGPDGTTEQPVKLAAHGGAGGANYACTQFDDYADSSIALAAPPYAGSYRPVDPLNTFRGTNGLGTWTLTVRDAVPGNTGVLNRVCLSLVGITCLPLKDLTISPTGTGSVELRWTSPDASWYRVWSTSVANNDGDPRANDPEWTLEAETFFDFGPALWQQPVGAAVYKNYVVQRICDFLEVNAPATGEAPVTGH